MPVTIALDATSVYFGDQWGSTINKVSKTGMVIERYDRAVTR